MHIYLPFQIKKKLLLRAFFMTSSIDLLPKRMLSTLMSWKLLSMMPNCSNLRRSRKLNLCQKLTFLCQGPLKRKSKQQKILEWTLLEIVINPMTLIWTRCYKTKLFKFCLNHPLVTAIHQILNTDQAHHQLTVATAVILIFYQVHINDCTLHYTVNIYRHVSTDSIGKNFVNLIQRLCLFNM